MPLIVKKGTLESLRVNERGDAFGGHDDRITAEVIVQLRDDAGAYGFRLLDDENLPIRQGYLDLLRDALAHGHEVKLDVDVPEGKEKGMIERMMLEPRPDRRGPASPRIHRDVVRGR